MPRRIRIEAVPRTPRAFTCSCDATTKSLDCEVAPAPSDTKENYKTPSSTGPIPVARNSNDLRRFGSFEAKAQAVLNSPLIEIRPRRSLNAVNSGIHLSRTENKGADFHTPLRLPSRRDLTSVTSRRLSHITLGGMPASVPLAKSRASCVTLNAPCPKLLKTVTRNSEPNDGKLSTSTPFSRTVEPSLTTPKVAVLHPSQSYHKYAESKDESPSAVTSDDDVEDRTGDDPETDDDLEGNVHPDHSELHPVKNEPGKNESYLVSPQASKSDSLAIMDESNYLESPHDVEILSDESRLSSISLRKFKLLVNVELSRIQSLCGEWLSVLHEEEERIPESGVDTIRANVGKAKLLLDKKFNFFVGLLDTALLQLDESQTVETPTNLNDLIGYWSLVSLCSFYYFIYQSYIAIF
ncbi:unnamed protein product [Protopolystoma xenopodis]|uniref:Uncharacterized protein n=1 Tax=Protopolystoma xenopodis TaxID=117903 RepID=A0A448WNJ2_9PLAT|nr:unnamed protein product [Protopolystoma xenopodis]